MKRKLKDYLEKRDFKKTTEPQQNSDQINKNQSIFVVQKHNASHLHYDLRLEANGVLKSWAVPKGPSLNPNEKRLAMMVEDHPLDYASFEGIIPEGNYGAGSVIVWDNGTYNVLGKLNKKENDKEIEDGLRKGKISFILNGKKLKGEFALVKLKSRGENDHLDLTKMRQAWLLIKKKDEFGTYQDIRKEDESVLSRRTNDDLETHDRSSILDFLDVKKSEMPHHIKPMLSTLIEKPFDDPLFLFEIKWDGYRAIAEINKNKIEFYSRNLTSFNYLFPSIIKSLEKFGYSAVLDGEIVVLDEKGIPKFQLLQNYQKEKRGNLVYYVFDLLYLNGYDLRKIPLIERKNLLKNIFPNLPNIKYSDHIENDGINFYMQAEKIGLEGIIAKNKNSQYLGGKRTRDWLKIKTGKRQEVVIGGFTEGRGGRKYFGALVLGVYKGNDLIYIGHTGTGFDENSLKDLYNKLSELIIEKSSFKDEPKVNTPVSWVKPVLVGEVKFSEWTKEGYMRQPVFLGLRVDKDIKQVTKENPSAIQKFNKSINKITGDEALIKINNHTLKLTNLNKIFFSQEGYTKKDLINYYRKIASVILPYLKDRPESLNRFPNGIEGESFFQKNVDHQLPSWVKTIDVYSETEKRRITYLLCQDEASLIFMANLGCIEINPWNSKAQSLKKPDYLVLDLDPLEVHIDQLIKTAQVAHKILESLKIPSFCKTSGARGIHIYLPLTAKYSYSQVRGFAKILATIINNKIPNITSIERNPRKREKKVYIDYLQNSMGQTLAAPYCLRPRPKAPVSTPLLWEEVNLKLDPSSFNIKSIFSRLDKMGDIFKPVLGRGIDIEKILNNPTLEKL